MLRRMSSTCVRAAECRVRCTVSTPWRGWFRVRLAVRHSQRRQFRPTVAFAGRHAHRVGGGRSDNRCAQRVRAGLARSSTTAPASRQRAEALDGGMSENCGGARS